MIGSFFLGGLVFLMSDSMFSTAFDVLIKILESYRSQIPSTLSCNSFMLIEIKFIHCHLYVLIAMKFISICND